MEGLTLRTRIVSAGVGNLSSLRGDGPQPSQVRAVRQLSSSSLGALRFLGPSNVTNFRGDQMHRCRRSGSSSSIVCLAKPDETAGGTERPDGFRALLSAITVPILAAVMVGAVQPAVLALGPDGIDFDVEGGRPFAAPKSQFSSPNPGGLEPNVESSKGSQYNAPSEDKLPEVDKLKKSDSPNNPFAGLFEKAKDRSKERGKSDALTIPGATPVVFRTVPVRNDESSITTSSPLLKSENSYRPPGKPAVAIDEPSVAQQPGTAPADQREGPVGNVVSKESEVVNEKTGNATVASK